MNSFSLAMFFFIFLNFSVFSFLLSLQPIEKKTVVPLSWAIEIKRKEKTKQLKKN